MYYRACDDDCAALLCCTKWDALVQFTTICTRCAAEMKASFALHTDCTLLDEVAFSFLLFLLIY
jgi:hypothetical protein